MRVLLDLETQDERARDAINLFCYQVKKWIGSYAAALGGLDKIVFSGGIGENSPVVRERICAGLNFLGVEIDKEQNSANEQLISAKTGRVAVRVIKTDEEQMIAQNVSKLLSLHPDENPDFKPFCKPMPE